MTDYRGILRMKSKGFSATAIASSLGVNKRTVLSCINRAAEAGFGEAGRDVCPSRLLQDGRGVEEEQHDACAALEPVCLGMKETGT